MTRHCWFPDNTVLCNFSAVDRLSLLEKVLDGRGRWTQAVAAEAEQSKRYWPKLSQLLADGWLGEPIEIDDPTETALKNTVDLMREAIVGGLVVADDGCAGLCGRPTKGFQMGFVLRSARAVEGEQLAVCLVDGKSRSGGRLSNVEIHRPIRRWV